MIKLGTYRYVFFQKDATVSLYNEIIAGLIIRNRPFENLSFDLS